MDGQDHKITAPSATLGHEGHGVHLCHKCGWPFPNSHPSAKHRRAHKRVCGTIEGYKTIHSEGHDHNLAVSDDDNASDDDELHTPSPNMLKKMGGSSGREGEKSAKSEDDVFSDAVTDFSDSGISPLSGKSLEGDLNGNVTLEVKEASDRIEQSNDARSEEISKHVPLSNENNQRDNVVLITDDSQPEEGKVLDQTIVAGESQDALHDKLESELAIHDPPLPSESLQFLVHSSESILANKTNESIDASEGVKEDSYSTENIGSTVSVGQNNSLEGSLLSSSSVKTDESTKLKDINKHSDVACMISSIEKEEMLEASLDGGQTANNTDNSEEEKFGITGNKSLESKNLSFACKDDTTAIANKDVNHCGENINCKVLENGNENDEVASEKITEFSSSCAADSDTKSLLEVSENRDDSFEESIHEEHGVDKLTEAGSEVDRDIGDKNFTEQTVSPRTSELPNDIQVTKNVVEVESPEDLISKEFTSPLSKDDSCIREDGNASEAIEVTAKDHENNVMTREISEKLTEFSSLCAADTDVRSLHKLSENRDNVFEQSIQEHGVDHDIADKNFLEHTVSPITSELTKNVVEVESPEDSISKESTSPLSNSVLLSRNAAKDDSCIREDARASEAIEVTAKDHESNVVTREISEKLTEFSSFCAADSDAKSLREVSENRDDGFEKSIQEHGVDHDNGDTLSAITSELTKNVVEVESPDVAETPEDSISKESTSPLPNSVLLSRNAAKDNSCIREDAKAPEEAIEVTAKDHESDVTRVISENLTFNMQVASPEVKLTHSSNDLSTSKALTSDECVKQIVLSQSDVQEFDGTSDKTIVNVEGTTSISAKSVLPEVDDKSTKRTDEASAIDVSGSLTSTSDSLEANCGSVVSDTLETNSQKHKSSTPDKSDTFEPPSFMTLVQSTAATEEIEAVKNDQRPKSNAIQAGWFPSLTNVVVETEGRKKNEEMIAKVTSWSPVKQQNSPLKSLLGEVKSQNAKIEGETKDDSLGVTSVSSETHMTKGQDTNKHVEEWNSPARYPIEMKKEKKGRSFWVPFVCCSSTHRDL